VAWMRLGERAERVRGDAGGDDVFAWAGVVGAGCRRVAVVEVGRAGPVVTVVVDAAVVAPVADADAAACSAHTRAKVRKLATIRCAEAKLPAVSPSTTWLRRKLGSSLSRRSWLW
jgi:hypothetical protein